MKNLTHLFGLECQGHQIEEERNMIMIEESKEMDQTSLHKIEEQPATIRKRALQMYCIYLTYLHAQADMEERDDVANNILMKYIDNTWRPFKITLKSITGEEFTPLEDIGSLEDCIVLSRVISKKNI